jgi:Putative zinc-finger
MTASSQTMDCPDARLSLGIYVLGAIDPADRALVDSHLATCRDCRDELAGLAGLPALLARVSSEEAIALAATDLLSPDGVEEFVREIVREKEPPPELLAAVLDLTAARRRRRRWREASLGVAAALIIAAGVFGGLRLGASPTPAPASNGLAGVADPGPASGPWQTVTASVQGMSATVSYRPMGWGTQLAVKVNGIPVGVSCKFYVVGPDGSKTLAGSWQTDNREGMVSYPVSSAIASSGMRGFQIAVGKSRSITVNA